MNFRSFTLGPTSVTVVLSTGRSFTVTYADIKAHYDAASGSVSAKKGAVLTWLRNAWEAQFGTALFPKGQITGDFDPATGRVTELTCTHPVW